MELKLVDAKVKGTVTAPDGIFACPYNEGLVHQLLVAHMANARSGTRAQKARSDVAKSTRKPWRQKGTGRARAGMASSPLWRGGGKTFPNLPDENFSRKVNRKMQRAALRSIFSELARQDRLGIVEEFSVATPRTKELRLKLKEMGYDDVLIVTGEMDANLALAARNLPQVAVVDAEHADVVQLIRFAHVLMTKEALKRIAERLA
jgi:large subunit ribosomal protein L4